MGEKKGITMGLPELVSYATKAVSDPDQGWQSIVHQLEDGVVGAWFVRSLEPQPWKVGTIFRWQGTMGSEGDLILTEWDPISRVCAFDLKNKENWIWRQQSYRIVRHGNDWSIHIEVRAKRPFTLQGVITKITDLFPEPSLAQIETSRLR